MRYIFDIDNTICITTGSDYYNSTPMMFRIEVINGLYAAGHDVVYWTSRGMASGKNWEAFTKEQLDKWGCKYSELLFNKPMYDVWVDDKAFNDSDFFTR